MAGQWYVKKAGKRAGPFSWERLKALADKGQFSPDDLVRQEGVGAWDPAGQVKGLFGDGGSPGGGSESSSTRVARSSKGSGEPSQAKPLPTARPIAESKPAGEADSAAEAPEVAGEASGPPKLPDVGPAPSDGPSDEFDLGIDPAPSGVAGGRRYGARGPQTGRRNTIVVAAVGVMFFVVLAVGVGLTRSNRGTVDRSPPSEAPAVEPGAADEAPGVQGPEAFDVESLDAFDDLEALDIFSSLGAESGPPDAAEPAPEPTVDEGAKSRPGRRKQ